ncbi:MAG: hypothetical protein IJ214_04095 [Clostridia bacterium]|nr:hypothetical protein [Clostridia bacterium]
MAVNAEEAEYEKKNQKVQNALYKAAIGYKVRLKKPVKVKEETNRPGEGKQVVERMVTVEEEKYVEPKITAQMFWLKSRMPEKWGDGERVLGEVQEEITPVLEAYADVLERTAETRRIEDMEDGDADTIRAAE